MRWWIYQKERFPIVAHGPLIAAFSSCAVSFSALLLGDGLPSWRAYLVAFATCFLFFLQLRIADEFKDQEEDARYRPYRPVPRGLIKLRELGVLFIIAAATQLALALWFFPPLALVLLAAWLYLALMSVEFFARSWLKARPLTYLWTHMLIMPIVDFYATATHWLPTGEKPLTGLAFFLAASFTNGVVIELGRKLRQPADEEEGVETYSVLWGRTRAAWIWWTMLLATVVFASLAALQIDWLSPVLFSLTLLLVVAAVLVGRFSGHGLSGKVLENFSGLWTLVLYLSLGIVPLLVKSF